MHNFDRSLLKSSEDFRLSSSRTNSSNFDCSETGWIKFLSNVRLLRFDFDGAIGFFIGRASDCTDFINRMIFILRNFNNAYLLINVNLLLNVLFTIYRSIEWRNFIWLQLVLIYCIIKTARVLMSWSSFSLYLIFLCFVWSFTWVSSSSLYCKLYSRYIEIKIFQFVMLTNHI